MVEAVVEFDYTALEPDELSIQKGDIITNIKQQPGGWWEGVLKGKKGMFPDNFVKVIDANPNEEKTTGVVLRKKSAGGRRRCRVLFSYKPHNQDELELHENELIEVLGEVEEGWWRGRLNNKVGVFPSNFVKEEADDSVEVKPEHASSSEIKHDDSSVETESVSGGVSVKHNKNDLASSLTANNKNCSPDVTTNGSTITDINGPSLPPKPIREQCVVRFSYSAANEDELSLHVGEVLSIISKTTPEQGWWKGELNGKVGVFPDNFVEVLAQSGPIDIPDKPINSSTPHNHKDASPKSQSEADDRPKSMINKKPAPPPTKKPSPAPPPGLKATPAPPLPSKGASPAKNRMTAPSPPQINLEEDATDGPVHSKNHRQNHRGEIKSNGSENLDFDNVERSAMLTHPTVMRAKAPKRRPPSAVFKEQMEISATMNGSYEEDEKPSTDAEEQLSRSQTPPIVNRWEKKSGAKMPWVEELKLNQAKGKVKAPPPLDGVVNDKRANFDSAVEKRNANPVIPTKPSEGLPPIPKKPTRKSYHQGCNVDLSYESRIARQNKLSAPGYKTQTPAVNQQPQVPPLSSPRRLSPAEVAAATQLPLARGSKEIVEAVEVPVNGQRRVDDWRTAPIPGQRPPSLSPDDSEINELRNKVFLMERRLISLEGKLAEEQEHRRAMQKEMEKIRSLVVQV